MGKYTDRSKTWELLNSWWIILSFFPVFGPPIAFFYIASKAKKKVWYYIGFGIVFVNAILFWGQGAIAAMIGDKNVGGLLFTSFVIEVVLAFIFHKEYLIRLDMLTKVNIKQIEENAYRTRIADELFKKGVPVKEPNSQYVESLDEIEKTDKGGSDETASPIDINTCSVEELAKLPGVSLVLAKKAINYRHANNGFTSISEFYRIVELKPHFIAQIDDTIICKKNKKEATSINVSSVGRQLDL